MAVIKSRTRIEEEDGLPSGLPYKLKFPNGSLTDNGDGTFSYAAASSGQLVYDAVVAPSGGDYTDVASAIAAGKVSIKVKPGTYTVSATIAITTAGTIIDGSGWTTIFKADTNLNANIFTISGTDCELRNFKLDGNSANVSSGDLVESSGSGLVVDHLYFYDGEDEGLDINGSINVKVTRCKWEGSQFLSAMTVTGNDFLMSDCFIENFTSSAIGFNLPTRSFINNCAFSLTSGSGTNVMTVGTESKVVNCKIGTVNANVLNALSINNNSQVSNCDLIVTGGNAALNIAGTYCSVSNCYLLGGTATDYLIDCNTSSNVMISNNVMTTCEKEAIYLGGGDHCSVVGNSILASGQGINNTYAAILLTGTSTYNTIIGNTINSATVNKIAYAVKEAAAADDFNVISNNTVVGAQTATYLIQGVGSNKLASPQKKSVEIVVFDYTTDTATGDGKGYFHVTSDLNGMNLVGVHAQVITAGTTNTTDIQIANVTDLVDMLSTKITVDSGETGSDTAATAAVINAAADDVATNDLLRIDVDAVSTTPAKGLIVTLEFQLP